MRKLFLLYIPLVLFSACKLDKPEQIPGFIKIDSLVTDLNTETQGSNSNNFTEAWVSIDGQQVGIFDIPALFPTLEVGTRTILIRPGIKRNGAAAARVDHPHFENFELGNQKISIGDTLTINPVFKLRSGIKAWFEDFEDAGFKLNNSANNDTDMVRLENDPNVFEGRASGYVFLADESKKFSVSTSENFNFRIGTPVYFELDYKIDGFLKVSLVVHTTGSPDITRTVLFIVPKKDASGNSIYNKIYVSLSEIISLEANATSFDIKLEGINNTGQTNASYYIDNLKVLYP